MNFILSIILFSLVLLAAAGILVWLVWRTIREHALLRRTLDLSMLQVTLPKDLKPDEKEESIGDQVKERIAIAEQFLSTLSNLPTKSWDQWLYGNPIIVFELVARSDGLIVFQAGTERRYLDHLEKQIYAHYPDAEVTPASEFTLFESGDTIRTGLMRLQKPHHLPIATYKELEIDPIQSLTGALAKIRDGDAAVIQFVMRPASTKNRRRATSAARLVIQGKQNDIAEKASLMEKGKQALTSNDKRAKNEADAKQLTPRMQQKIELVEQKMSQQQFDVNIRVGVSTRQPEEADRVFNAIVSDFAQYDMPDLNFLRLRTPGKNTGFLRDIIFRVPRSGKSNTLSTTEIASLFHFPLPTTSTPNILWRGSKVAPAPAELNQEGILLGENVYRGITTPIHFSPDDRRRHLYLIGQTGTGKTTLFLNMIIQDIKAGNGVGVVDPHGDLIEDILAHIPPERQHDVILFDPRDTEMPLGFNMLEVNNPAQKDLVVNEVVQILQKLAARLNPESVGPMFEHYLRNALGALIEDENSTLMDVPRMFVDEKFRQAILAKNTNPTIIQFWEQEFAQSQKGQMSADMLSYVISKLGRFIGNEVVRNLIGQSKSSFDVRDVMDNKKILLCNLSKGSLGDINSDLLGFVLVSKIQIAALGRSDIPESERADFYLYLDEFQNFTTDSISTILSEARKYKLNLNLTHQFIKQLDDKIRDAVFGNIGTQISYRIGSEDAEFMAKQFEPVFSQYDLVNLDRFTAITRLLAEGAPQRPFSLRIPPPPSGGSPEMRESVRAFSREKYGRPKEAVQKEILKRFSIGNESVSPEAPASGDYMSESLFDVN